MAAKETVTQFSRVPVSRLSFLHFTLANVFELSISRSQWFLKRSFKLGECITPYPFESREITSKPEHQECHCCASMADHLTTQKN